MNTNRIAAVAALALAAFAAQAETPDPSGQFAATVNGATQRADVARTAQAPRTGANPWSIQYNPLATFQSAKTRAQVQAEFLRSRDAVTAFTGEDSGSAYLAARQQPAATRFAGQPRAAH